MKSDAGMREGDKRSKKKGDTSELMISTPDSTVGLFSPCLHLRDSESSP